MKTITGSGWTGVRRSRWGFGRGGWPLLWHVLYELIFVSGVRVSLTSGKRYVATGLPKFFQGVYLLMAVKVTVG